MHLSGRSSNIEIDVARISLRYISIYPQFAGSVYNRFMARGGRSGTISGEPKLGVIDYSSTPLLLLLPSSG